MALWDGCEAVLSSGAVDGRVAAAYSRMKHGDLDAVNFFACHLTSRAMRSDRLNEAVITGTLESAAFLLRSGNFVATQKLLRVILNPEHTDHLPQFLQTIPTASILKVYAAAADDNFRGRNERLYLPSLVALETALEEHGALDANGQAVGAFPAGLV